MLVGGLTILYRKVFPSNNESLISAFEITRHQVFRQWEHKARVLAPDNLEQSLLNSAINVQIRNATSNDSYLCAVFLHADKHSLKQLHSNVDNLRGSCKWAVIAYGGDEALFDNQRTLLEAIKHVELAIYRYAPRPCEPSPLACNNASTATFGLLAVSICLVIPAAISSALIR